MVLIKKPLSDSSLRGQLKQTAKKIVREGFEQVGELRKDLVHNFTRLPQAVISGVSGRKTTQEWQEEWLSDSEKKKRQERLSGEIGKYSPLDLKHHFGTTDLQEASQIRQQLLSVQEAKWGLNKPVNLNFKAPSSQSDYGKQLAKEQQKKQTPIYDQVWQEKEEQKKRQEEAQKAQAKQQLAPPSSKPQAGGWLKPRIKKPSSADLERRSETRAAAGK